MNEEKQKPKLSKEQQTAIVTRLARFETPSAVQEFVKTEYGKEIAFNSIKFYLHSKKWKPMLERLRQEYVEPIMDIPVSHKFVRLSRLEDLYQSSSMLGKVDQCRGILGDAREEVEGPKSNPSGNTFYTQVNNFSDEDLHKKKDDILKRIKILDVGQKEIKIRDEAIPE